MTFEERLAVLGVETSDILPSEKHCSNLYEKFFNLVERICKEMGEEFDQEMLLSYLIIAIAKRDEIIDRMETRIVNLTGERDYLEGRMNITGGDCGSCVHDHRGGCPIESPHKKCESYIFARVPEDWRPDDA